MYMLFSRELVRHVYIYTCMYMYMYINDCVQLDPLEQLKARCMGGEGTTCIYFYDTCAGKVIQYVSKKNTNRSNGTSKVTYP